MNRLEGRAALITGAARGIGLAIAERFVRDGARVFLVDIDAAGAARAAQAVRGGYTTADLSSTASIPRIVADAQAYLGSIDILVNNAGITHEASLLELDEEGFDRVLNINLKAALFLAQAVAPAMIAAKRGAIINMSSINALFAMPGRISYSVSKAAIGQLTNVLALELAPHGVRVNAIGPGTIETEMARSFATNDAVRRAILSRTPMGRLGDPAEIAAVASFLASDDASYITGQTIFPDGGRMGLAYTMPFP